MSPCLTLRGYSTALFSTWYFVDELGCLFDCGDGVCAGLLQKGRKVKHVFISHADRDHLGGLFQFLQLNGRPDLCVHYPADCGSFPAVAEFTQRFDPQSSGTRWNPVRPGDEVSIRGDLVVRAVENAHVLASPGQSKSLSYFVESISRKLKPEHQGKSGEQLAALRSDLGPEALVNAVRTTRLVYSGDTPVATDRRYDDAEVLIHEATFLTADELPSADSPRNRHSSLDQVIPMLVDSGVRTLVLGHFSSRYDEATIRSAVESMMKRYQPSFHLELVLPGTMWRGRLSRSPLATGES